LPEELLLACPTKGAQDTLKSLHLIFLKIVTEPIDFLKWGRKQEENIYIYIYGCGILV